jgi:hypothetical protein
MFYALKGGKSPREDCSASYGRQESERARTVAQTIDGSSCPPATEAAGRASVMEGVGTDELRVDPTNGRRGQSQPASP